MITSVVTEIYFALPCLIIPGNLRCCETFLGLKIWYPKISSIPIFTMKIAISKPFQRPSWRLSSDVADVSRMESGRQTWLNTWVVPSLAAGFERSMQSCIQACYFCASSFGLDFKGTSTGKHGFHVFFYYVLKVLTMKHRRATQVISWFISRNYIFITFIPRFSWEAPWLSLTGGFQSIVASDFPAPRILESSRWRFESHPHTAEKFRGQCLLAAKVTGFVGKGCDKRGTIWLFTIAMEHPWNKWI
jgi:hypothetical protein